MSLLERPEWTDAALNTALRVAAQELLFIAEELQQLARRWHTSAAKRIRLQAEEIREWGEIALLARDEGDRWSRLEALQLAQERTGAADALLARWRQSTHTYQNIQLAAGTARARSNGA